MGVFKYEAKSLSGEVVKGEVEANTDAEARIKIRANRLIPISVSVGGSAKSSKGFDFANFQLGKAKVKPKDLQVFTRQLSVLISAGVPIVPSVEALARGAKSVTLREALNTIAQDISSGKKMGEAFKAQPHVFDRFYVNMVTAGEEGGVLEVVLIRLAAYIEKAVKLQSQIKGAMVYPIAVLVIAMAVVAGLLIFVVPQFAELFESSGKKLPAITQAVMDMSDYVVANWHIILGVIIGSIVGFKQYYKTSSGKMVVDNLMIKLPLFGDLIIKSSLAKFARTQATLLGAGVPIMNSLEIARQVMGNYPMEKMVERIKEAISQGKTMATPLSQEPMVPNLVIQMVAVGDQTGSLDNMLAKVADFFEDEVEAIVASLTSLIEPVMIVVLGGIVAGLVLAMYMPIFQMAGGV